MPCFGPSALRASQVMAGCFHYARVVPELWEDRLLRLRAMGLNAIQTCTSSSPPLCHFPPTHPPSFA